MKYNVDEKGYYGNFGGAFIPEMLYPNVNERLNPTLLEAFKKNPFTHSLTGVA